MKQSLESLFSQGNAQRTQFLKTETYSVTGFWITSYWVLVLSWWESLTWDFLVHLTRSCYDCKGKGIHILQRMSLLPRKTLLIFLTSDKEKHNLYSFLCIKCLHVLIWEHCYMCLTVRFGFHPASNNLCGWYTPMCYNKYTVLLHYIYSNAYLTSCFLLI